MDNAITIKQIKKLGRLPSGKKVKHLTATTLIGLLSEPLPVEDRVFIALSLADVSVVKEFAAWCDSKVPPHARAATDTVPYAIEAAEFVVADAARIAYADAASDPKKATKAATDAILTARGEQIKWLGKKLA